MERKVKNIIAGGVLAASLLLGGGTMYLASQPKGSMGGNPPSGMQNGTPPNMNSNNSDSSNSNSNSSDSSSTATSLASTSSDSSSSSATQNNNQQNMMKGDKKGKGFSVIYYAAFGLEALAFSLALVYLIVTRGSAMSVSDALATVNMKIIATLAVVVFTCALSVGSIYGATKLSSNGPKMTMNGQMPSQNNSSDSSSSSTTNE